MTEYSRTEYIRGARAQAPAYILWFGCVFLLFGLHRFYLRQYVTGVIWFCTFGFFFIGQFVDLFLIPGRVETLNMRELERAKRLRRSTGHTPVPTQQSSQPRPPGMPLRKSCPDCGESIASPARVCRHCGLDLTQPFQEREDAITICACSECGHILEVPNHLLGVPGKCEHCGVVTTPTPPKVGAP